MGTIAIMHKKSTHEKLRLAIVEKRTFVGRNRKVELE